MHQSNQTSCLNTGYRFIWLKFQCHNIPWIILFFIFQCNFYFFKTAASDSRDRYNDSRDRYSDNRDRYNDSRDRYSDNRDRYSDNRDRYNDNRDRYSDNRDRYNKRDRYNDNRDRYNDNRDRYSNRLVDSPLNYQELPYLSSFQLFHDPESQVQHLRQRQSRSIFSQHCWSL